MLKALADLIHSTVGRAAKQDAAAARAAGKAPERVPSPGAAPGAKNPVMKKPRDPSASLEHEVIYAVITLYAGLSAVILGIHFLQPDRSKPDAAPALARPETAVGTGAEGR